MIDTIFKIIGVLGIYALGLYSGLFVAALIVSNRDREDYEEHEWQDVFKDGGKQENKD